MVHFTHIGHKKIIIIGLFLLFCCCFLANNKRRITYNKKRIDEYIQKIQLYTNKKDRNKLKRLIQNDDAVNQLLSDFSNKTMKVIDVSYYNLTDTILRVELKCNFSKQSQVYLIMIDNEEFKWQVYVTGFV